MMTKKLYSLFFVALTLACAAPVSAGKAEIARKAIAQFQPYAQQARLLAAPHKDKAQELMKYAAQTFVKDYVQKGLEKAFSQETKPKAIKKKASHEEAATENGIPTLLAHVQKMHRTTDLQTLRVKALCDQSDEIIQKHEAHTA